MWFLDDLCPSYIVKLVVEINNGRGAQLVKDPPLDKQIHPALLL